MIELCKMWYLHSIMWNVNEANGSDFNKPPLSSCLGMVEMIPSAETLRKIQVEHGVTGSFKDRPLADWLQKHNPTEEEYEKVLYTLILIQH